MHHADQRLPQLCGGSCEAGTLYPGHVFVSKQATEDRKKATQRRADAVADAWDQDGAGHSGDAGIFLCFLLAIESCCSICLVDTGKTHPSQDMGISARDGLAQEVYEATNQAKVLLLSSLF